MLAHESSFQFLDSSNLLYACNGQFLALVAEPGTVTIINIYNSDENRLTLKGHQNCVTALSFSGDAANNYLCSAASDNIILWKTADFKSSFLTQESVEGFILAQPQGLVNSLNFNENNSLIAASIENEIAIYSTEARKILLTLCGHSRKVTGAKFCLHDTSTLVSISEDRTFKVWNIKSSAMLYDSNVIPLTNLNSLVMISNQKSFVLGSTDGCIRIYDLTRGGGYKCLHNQDLTKHSNEQASNSFKVNTRTISPDDASALLCLHENMGVCLVGMSDMIVILNLVTFEVSSTFQFSESMGSLTGTSPLLIKSVDHMLISNSFISDKVVLIIREGTKLHIISLWLEFKVIQSTFCDGDRRKEHKDTNDIGTVSVISRKPLVPNSILKSEIIFKPTDRKSNTHSKTSTVAKPGSLNKCGKILDKQPVTFHRNIKSSGYGATTKCYTSINKEKSRILKKAEILAPTQDIVLHSPRINLISARPPFSLTSSLKVSEVSAAINNMSFSENGNHLLCSSTDGVVTVLRKSANSYCIEKAYPVHDQMINAVQFSHSGNMFISCDDKKAHIFSLKKDPPVLTLNQYFGNLMSDKTGYKNNIEFPSSLSHAQFYFMDKFIILSSKNELLLYNYFIDTTQTDLKRNPIGCRYKIVKSFPMTQCKYITTFSAVNSFYSYIGLCCCSNKSLSVIDFNVGSVITNLSCIHERTIHAVEQYTGSSNSPLSSSPHDMFLTTAVCDCVKLWDLRSNKCVRKFEDHKNRMHHCKASFSPCGRYVSAGSEDGHAYIYDARHGSMIEKVDSDTECTLCIPFNPVFSEVVASTLDGHIKCLCHSGPS